MSDAGTGEAASHAADGFEDSLDIAVIGMAGRFPGAETVEEYWSNLRAGTCSVTRFEEDELIARGVDPVVLGNPGHVRFGYVLEGARTFDAGFFGYAPREAELMDPQHRVLLECAWQAMESAGHDPQRYGGRTGVFAGAGNNTYYLHNIATQPRAAELLNDKQVTIGNRSDFLSSRISYKLGLEGPSVNIQSACSTSLVAVAEACQALLAYQCDMVLAGGVAIDDTRRDGYVYRQDGMLSPDGYCRTFDARARGTVGGDGAGMVVLKRLKDAISDRDHIHAVIKASVVNNDGARRAGFSAPSATLQAEAIATALADADVPAESIRYVEAHGSATPLGDPIEIRALTAAFGDVGASHCAVGSAKTNIGHLDSAAGVAGLIKTVLAVEHGHIPPTLHFESPNPRLDLEGSPFYVNTAPLPWPDHEGPRRAGVSSFGLGGTNAHLIVEQAPRVPTPPRPASGGEEQLLVMSAKSAEALEAATDRLHDHLRSHPEQHLADIAFTLKEGRRSFPFRRMLVCAGTDGAVAALEARDDGRVLTAVAPDAPDRPVAFMFAGFGSQYPGAARELHDREPVFREALNRCAHHLGRLLDEDVLALLLDDSATAGAGRPPDDFRRLLLQPEPGEHPLDQPRLGYPAVFALEYALVELWKAWGVEPGVMIGHSLGEYVAACVAGVFSLPDALRLVVERARRIEEQGRGAMLAVPLSEDSVTAYTDDDVFLAAVNGPHSCVLSGTVEGIERVGRELAGADIVSRRMTTRHAFHSPLMEPVAEPYREVLRSVRLNPPSLPFVSNRTGTWITAEEATSPDYWVEHMCSTVRFADGIETLWSVPDIAVVEISPAPVHVTDALQHPAAAVTDRVVVPSLTRTPPGRSARASLLDAAGRLWLAGHRDVSPTVPSGRRIPLPTYPFQRRTYWLEPGAVRPGNTSGQERCGSLPQWFHTPSWQRLGAGASTPPAGLADRNWLVFTDEEGVGRRVADRLERLGATVHVVAAGHAWTRKADRAYVLDPGQPAHFVNLAEALRGDGGLPDRVVHCLAVGNDARNAEEPRAVRALLHRAFDSLVQWAQATGTELMTRPQRWDVLSTEVYSVIGDEVLCPPKAAVSGICRVLTQEYPSLNCVHVDLGPDEALEAAATADRLVEELVRPAAEPTLALRGRHYWKPTYLKTGLPARSGAPVRRDGVYLITGGLGRIGLLMAHALAELDRVHLVLLGRTGLPPRETWDEERHPVAVQETIAAVRAIEDLGSRVMVVSADVADPVAMREAKERIVQTLGPLSGVLHCAGTTGPDAHRSIAELGARESSWHFGPKLHGTRVLHGTLADQRLDFAILCSSIAALLGGLGFAAYAAANSVQDAFAQRFHCPELPWTSVNWEAWLFSGRSREESELGAAIRELALTPDEGRQVFHALLNAAPQPQVVVSTGDLLRRQEVWSAPVADDATTVRLHERPHLRNPYVPPVSDAECEVAAIWQELLGVAEVGIHDNFFELGGSSLLGLQVVHRLRRELGVAVPLTIVYEGPTVRTLGELVEGLREGR
ncbi:beta-ketoacyl synthase N-terminal-like domain-containing protein [Streptomyces sp. NPDC014734]|uniref:type I polyketide synthase n=1 Tax=Streptomyces sp. NPDC014734 TaxID=3364886 RepID=UPI0037016A0C